MVKFCIGYYQTQMKQNPSNHNEPLFEWVMAFPGMSSLYSYKPKTYFAYTDSFANLFDHQWRIYNTWNDTFTTHTFTNHRFDNDLSNQCTFKQQNNGTLPKGLMRKNNGKYMHRKYEKQT